jgi:predicted CXXCH cytochrome family protein
MLTTAALLVVALLVIFQVVRALGPRRGGVVALLLVLTPVSIWGALEWRVHQELPPPEDQTASTPLQAQACFKCHESHYTSWHNTYHRTMTRDATPETVKGDFNDVVHQYRGVESRMSRRDGHFFIETLDPEWEKDYARRGIPLEKAGTPQLREFSVDRVVGSHWFQQMLHRDEEGRYWRLPMAYHIVEKRWININGAFLVPDTVRFSGFMSVWNENCLYCHNTRVVKNPVLFPDEIPGYRTKVGELGISCEACHGAAERHVLAHRNPARRYDQHDSGEPDPTIVNPAKLSVTRATDVCARCHGGLSPRLHEWDRTTHADPFLPGRDLKRFFYQGFSEAELRLRRLDQDNIVVPPRPEPLDGRFWGDGTPLTTALEYQGMALSACYQNGHGTMSCLSCHSMHQSEPNHQVKDGMRTNAACYSCHPAFREKLVEHTHHGADSNGSLCANCHMPYQVFSLLDTHRTHRIAIPRVKDSLGTGKPHACNLCHLDKSLGWTQENLGKWYGTKPEPLSEDDRTLASSLLHLAQSDARSRAVVAGAFAWPPAQQASGRDLPTLLLPRILENERYEAVRYTAHKALRSLYGAAVNDYNYQGTPAERAAQLRKLRLVLERFEPVDRIRYPNLPLTSRGLLAEDVFQRLLRSRSDPDVNINE